MWFLIQTAYKVQVTVGLVTIFEIPVTNGGEWHVACVDVNSQFLHTMY